MKTFLNGFLICIGVVLLSVVSSAGYNLWYENHADACISQEDTTTYVQNAVAQVLNPTFMSIDDVNQYYQKVTDESSIDSTFRSIPFETLVNIAQVIIGREGRATKRDIVYEYRQKYKSLYQYIKPAEALKAVVENEQNTPPPIRNMDTTDIKLNE